MRSYAEPVDVSRRDEAPEQFLWRGRLHLVRAVLARWTEAGCWWESAAARAVVGGDAAGAAAAPPDDLATAPIPASPKWAQRAWGEPAPDVGAAVGPMAVDDGEREFWRVEAAAGRSASPGVYDLCFDWSRGQWLLSRVLD